MKVREFSSEAEWEAAGLEAFMSAAEAARHVGRNRVDFILAGGATPEGIYRRLAGDKKVASAFRGLVVGLWLGDERAVGPEDKARNGSLLNMCFRAAPWTCRLHLWPAGPAPEAAESYAKLLMEELGPAPRFDLAFLGLGDDGHTASLFPGDPILKVKDSLAHASTAPGEPRSRMSLTYPVLKGAKAIRFFAKGPGKKAVVEALAKGGTGFPSAKLEGENTEILYLK